MTKRLLLLTVLCAAFVAGPTPRTAQALPHGCVSASSDHWVHADAFRRGFGFSAYRDTPCTFRYLPGDTFSGAGRFAVSCESGGHYFHPDYYEDGSSSFDKRVPIPQPCKRGDVVTINGFHTGTGGSVVAGGLGVAPSPSLRRDKGDFAALCDTPSQARAAVQLAPPVNYNGVLTFGGVVTCRGASVTIKSVTISGLGGHPEPVSAGSAACNRCRDDVSVSGEVPARWTEWDVEMRFVVSRPGQAHVAGVRVGRYVTTWAGHVTTVYPAPQDSCVDEALAC